ncbi:MAG: YeeE/YedE family protein [Sinobacteraceae bacterium]|nr:YeeE/YedE family protein [Nevskiaceae bacterium]
MSIAMVLSGLVCGGIFGFALERAGFASACKLTGQLRFKDWTVFNVMFTAILVCAFGLFGLQLLGVIGTYDVYIPSAFLYATLLGGVGVGAGMAVGGFCPGTSVVGFCSGHMDGLVFFVGLILGTFVFAGAYEAIEPMLIALPAPQAQTLPELLNLPTIVVLLLMTAMAAAVGYFSRNPEKLRRLLSRRSALAAGQQETARQGNA